MEKKIKFISIILLCISLILLFYTFYESEIKYDGNKHSKYLKYYLFCIFLIIFSFRSFYLKRETITNILTIFISLAFTLYSINGFLIFKKIIFDDRHIIQVYQDLKNTENDIAVSVYPREHYDDEDYPLFSLSSISNKKTLHCNENGYFSIHNTDRYGFNNLDNEWKKEVIEFMLVGDSFTHGACVNEPDTISGNLREMVKDGGVLNLGYSTNGPLKEYATLREYLPLKKTKRVLWLYTERNDLSDLIKELKYKTLAEYLNDKKFTQHLHKRQDEIDRKLKKIFDKSVIKHFEEKQKEKRPIVSFLRLYTLREFIKDQFRKPQFNIDIQDEILKNFSEIINFAKNLSSQNNARFYFIYLPDYFKYKNKLYNNEQFRNYENVIEIVNNLNISIIDIHKDLMANHPDPLSLFPYRSFGHYNELGYKLVSQTIFKKILDYEKNK